MGHDNHHHVDDLSGFSLFRLIWPAALLIVLVFVTRNCFGCCADEACCKDGEKCCKGGAKKEMHKDHGAHGAEEKHGH